tara:strand:- start:2557 stop:3528 length:972 start_codon:yes stop_codon:yes gene_type:complete
MIKKKIKILVAGGSGFIGTNILKKISKNSNFQVFATLHKSKKYKRLSNVRYSKINLLNKKNCEKVTKNIDIIIMSAAISSGAKIMANSPLAHLTPNLIMNSLMLEAAYKNNVKKFVFLSSNTVYPAKKNFMKETDSSYSFFEGYHIVAWMKKFTEEMCQMYSLKIKKKMQTLIIRPGNLYGPFDKYDWKKSKVIAATVRKVYEKHSPILVWGDGKDLKDFLYIDDFVECLVKLIQKDTGIFNIFNIASGKNITIKELLKKLLKINNMKNWKIVFDKTKPSLIPVRRIDISKIKRFIKWTPKTTIEQGLKNTIEWYKKNKNDYI